ncbi:MAG: hypothetical protein AAF393_15615 [Pseudomonadota bacterium]
MFNRRQTRNGGVFTLCLLVVACTPVDEPLEPEYGAINTRLLDGELVSIDVIMKNATDVDQVIAFNDCAAAQYALIRGSGFVRRVTNDVQRRGRTWTGAGVYTLSDQHPGGGTAIDAEVVAAACQADGIPVV